MLRSGLLPGRSASRNTLNDRSFVALTADDLTRRRSLPPPLLFREPVRRAAPPGERPGERSRCIEGESFAERGTLSVANSRLLPPPALPPTVAGRRPCVAAWCFCHSLNSCLSAPRHACTWCDTTTVEARARRASGRTGRAALPSHLWPRPGVVTAASRARRVQRHDLRVRPDRLRQDAHDDGR